MSTDRRKYVDENLVALRGEVTSMRVVGSDFWSIARLRTVAGEVTAVGNLLGVKLGDSLELRGVYQVHPKHGEQFKVRECTVVVAADASGAVRWLAERLPEVGRGRALALVERFGVPGIWDVIEQWPGKLTEVDGITPGRAQAIAEVYAKFRGERDRMVKWKGWGLTDAQIARVFEKWGDEAEAKLAANPYLLSAEVAGFGFRRADDVARRMGLAADAPSRIRAALVHVLSEARGEGHVYLRGGALVGITAGHDVLGGIDTKLVWVELDALQESGDLVLRGRGEPRGPRVYTRVLDEAEEKVAAFVRSAA